MTEQKNEQSQSRRGLHPKTDLPQRSRYNDGQDCIEVGAVVFPSCALFRPEYSGLVGCIATNKGISP